MRIFQLGAIPQEHAVGGKARGLDLLIAEGHLVPRGISLSFSSPEDYNSLKLELESSEEKGPLLNQIINSLEGFASDLILRSSAPLEDGKLHSFAGLYLSVRCQHQNQGVRSALLKSMAALSSPQTQAYLTGNSMLHFVIQEFVQARFSGVLFVNSDGSAQVEVLWGDCEQLVSGQTTPFTLIYRDEKLRLVRSGDDPENKMIRHWNAIYGKLRELIQIVKSSNAFLGTDVEWLVDEKDSLFFLQRRPITRNLPFNFGGSGLPEPNEDREIPPHLGVKQANVTNVNLKENYPKSIKPFVLSLASSSYRHYFEHFAKALKVPINSETEPLLFSSVCHIDGFIFYNMSSIEALIHYLPLGPFIKNYFHQFIGYSQPKSEIQNQKVNSWHENILLLKFIFRSLISIRKSRKRVHQFGEEVRAFIQKANNNHISLKDQLQEFLRFRFERWSPLAMSDYSALISFGALNSFLKLFANDFYTKNQISFLLLGIDDLISTQNSTDLSQVVEKISKQSAIKKNWISASSKEILQLLKNDSNYSEIWSLFKKYQIDWGFRFSQELTLDEANYLENPQMLVDLIRALLLNDQGYSQQKKLSDLSKSYEFHLSEAIGQIRNSGFWGKFLGSIFFQFLIDWTRNSLRYRELSRTHQARLYAQLRQTLLLIGDQFCQQGLIVSRDDIFFLTYEEVLSILHRQFAFIKSLPEQINTRKYFHAQAAKLLPPSAQTFISENELLYERENEVLSADDQNDPLTGLVACAGMIEGRAVVINDLSEINLVKSGDILITQQTDPGWSPIFPLIQGLVVEHGGILSHGAILAREFGIPCLIGVPSVTKKIRTGDRIRIDGERGLVAFL